jgi:spore germination protein YaaH/flagellar hook assembly protein FlgD
MHVRRSALRKVPTRGVARVVSLVMAAMLLPAAGPARGGEAGAPILPVATADGAVAAIGGAVAAIGGAVAAADLTADGHATMAAGHANEVARDAARTTVDAAGPAAPDLGPYRTDPGQGPSEMYLDAQLHAGDPNGFVPGGRVDVGFEPRAGDGSTGGSLALPTLPAGRLSGAQMARDPAPSPGPGGPPGAAPPDPTGAGEVGTFDPIPVAARRTALAIPPTRQASAPGATGLLREIYGFLPYWEVSDASTRLNFSVLSDVAYFSIGVDGRGNLLKRNDDGSLTTGWAGWTSAAMTDVITEAHVAKTRVTLTLSVFAWTSAQASVQSALLGSPAARANLARQAVAAVRDRGADGINLDFEPLLQGHEAEFVDLVHDIRAGFAAIGRGYHVSFDAMGQPANYPLEDAVGSDGADAVFVMGYDYRTASSSHAGSVDPLRGPAYDLTETVQAYLARIPANRIILGVPYYGRAWSTVSDDPNADTQTGATHGYSTAVTYESAVDLAEEHGRRYDDREIAAWFAYRKQTCTSAGCATTWREVYYDDAQTLRARYDMVNQSGIRGVGIWALGYDGSRPELYKALADKFLTDTTPPLAGIVMLPPSQVNEGFGVGWSGVDDWHGVASYDLEVSTDGGPWLAWISATRATSDVWMGADGHTYAFRVRARDGAGNVSAWNVSSVFVAAPKLGAGGFARVVASQLNVRSAPDTTATRLASAGQGDVFAITGGPASADGYTWYRVNGPITTWQPAGYVRTDAWIAARGNGNENVVAIPAPNSTTVEAVLRGVAFGSASGSTASTGTGPTAAANRSFSPNGDGSKDGLSIRWTNGRALDTLALRVIGPDGSLAGSVPLPANVGAGAQSTTWDGMLNGSVVPDGSYVIQLEGTAGGVRVAWPSADPATAGQRAAVGITVDTRPPTLSDAAISATRLSPNGDGRYERVVVTGTGSADAVGWSLVATSVPDGVAVRTLAGPGTAPKVTWDGRADDGSVTADGSYDLTLRLSDAAGNPATRTWTTLVDATPPVPVVAATPAAFSPDGDRTADSARIAWSSSEAGTGSARLLHGTRLIRSWTLRGVSGTIVWEGGDAAGRAVPDGRYILELARTDATGNRATATVALLVDRTAGFLRAGPTVFFPQDGDAMAAVSTISFHLVRTAKVTLAILDLSGTRVRGAMTAATRGPGTWTWRWDGRVAGGAMAPRGTYVAVLTVVGPYGTTTLRRTIRADAFSWTVPAAVQAGDALRIGFRSTEPLASLPTATLRQAGVAPAAMTVVRQADGSYVATAPVSPNGPGAATIVLTGRDIGRHANSSTVTVTVR